MAVLSKHPVAAPPSAPEREKTAHLLLRGWCVAVLILAIGGSGWALLLGALMTAAIATFAALVSVVWWMLLRPPVQYRRLPWVAVAFVAWAGVSIAWSAWAAASAVLWTLLLTAAVQALFIGSVLSWRDIVRALASATKWLLGLSLLLELWVAFFTEGATPLSLGNLFTLEPIQGVFGDADQLAAASILAIIAFGVRFAARPPRRGLLIAWIVFAGALLLHARSATGSLTVAFVALVLATALLMRTATRPGERTRYYVLFTVAALALAALVAFAWTPLLSLFGGSGELTGGVWVAASLAFGPVGVVLLVLTALAYVWRAWFFGVDRPRWDLTADRPYSPLALLPTLVGALLLVQSVTAAGPALLWGWMLVVLLGFKIKQVPLVGVGVVETADVSERTTGELWGPAADVRGSNRPSR